MFDFFTDAEEYKAELSELIRQFDSYETSNSFSVGLETDGGDTTEIKITVNGKEFLFSNDVEIPQDRLGFRKITLRFLKNSLYKALCATLGRTLPWGALTGVRPSRLAYELLQSGTSFEDLPTELCNLYGISRGKAELLTDIVDNQRDYYTENPEYVNFYVHIPMCPSRCKYCSFVSVAIDKQKKYILPYVAALKKEISSAVSFIENTGKKVLSVYIGGGTPTVLGEEQLDEILSAIPYRDIEYTCEAGRPETITEKKLKILSRRGVNRISINPQTLFDETLAKIGRNHTVADFFEAYSVARQFDFNINVDLIAGLPDETANMFQTTVNEIERLRPDNITVHTLSQKRGSVFAEENFSRSVYGVEEMTDYAYKKLKSCGYVPYYLYRQKQMIDNLENVGYTLQGKQSVNNITTMEESISVIACGAGGISKTVVRQKVGGFRIERYANVKDIKQYLEQFDERENKKQLFLKNSLQ